MRLISICTSYNTYVIFKLPGKASVFMHSNACPVGKILGAVWCLGRSWWWTWNSGSMTCVTKRYWPVGGDGWWRNESTIWPPLDEQCWGRTAPFQEVHNMPVWLASVWRNEILIIIITLTPPTLSSSEAASIFQLLLTNYSRTSLSSEYICFYIFGI